MAEDRVLQQVQLLSLEDAGLERAVLPVQKHPPGWKTQRPSVRAPVVQEVLTALVGGVQRPPVEL